MNFMKRMIYAVVLVLALPFLGGCGKTLQYEPKKLTHLNVVNADDWAEKDGVRMYIQKFDADMNAYYFNKSNLYAYVYQVTVNNNSQDEWVFSPEYLSVILESPEAIHKNLSPSFGRAFGMQYMFGSVMGGAYAFKQYETKQRIAKDIGKKGFERAVTIAPGKKYSALLFVHPRNIKPRLGITLLHAEMPSKRLEYTLSMR